MLRRGLDEMVLDPEIFEQELDRIVAIRPDAAHFRRRHHDDLRFRFREKLPHRRAIQEIEFRARAGEKFRVTLRLQFAQNRPAREPAVSGDKYRFFLGHLRETVTRAAIGKTRRDGGNSGRWECE